MRIPLAAALFSTALFACGGAFAAPKQQTSSTPQETTAQGKTETPSKTTKVKTTSVVGKVDKIEADKSLEVTTPKGHTQTFDLSAKDTTVTGTENVKVGEMVRVRQKTENGHTTINIEPYSSASHRHGHHASTDNTGAAPTTK
jgi:hypothetical protein